MNYGTQSLAAALGIMLGLTVFTLSTNAQTPPSAREVAEYQGLHRAAHEGDMNLLEKLLAEGADPEARDKAGRTPLHIAAFASHDNVVRLLAAHGADLDALENQAYDIVTIASVADDLELLDLALDLGASAANITSPYDGTALIAAAHLGHHEVVARLIAAGAPLDHVNNLGWTALMEAVVLGDGGPAHVKTAKHLVDAGADRTITDRQGASPLDHAVARGYDRLVEVLR